MKHYVRIWYLGLFVSEDSVREVATREERPELGANAYGWQFFDRESAVSPDGETLLGKEKNHSPTYYIGTELTAEQAIAEGNSIARSNIEGNGYKRLVRTARGQMFPLNDGDVVVRP